MLVLGCLTAGGRGSQLQFSIMFLDFNCCFLARLRSKRSVRTSVYAGFAVLLLTFASSSLVIPLLAAIRTSLAITTGDAAMTTIAYFAGCAASLLFFGRLSNLSVDGL